MLMSLFAQSAALAPKSPPISSVMLPSVEFNIPLSSKMIMPSDLVFFSVISFKTFLSITAKNPSELPVTKTEPLICSPSLSTYKPSKLFAALRMSKPLFVVTITTGISSINFSTSSTLSEVNSLYEVSTLPLSLTSSAFKVMSSPALRTLFLLLVKSVPAVNVISFSDSILPFNASELSEVISTFLVAFKPFNVKPSGFALCNLTLLLSFMVAVLIKLSALSKVISFVAETSSLSVNSSFLPSACAIEPSELALKNSPFTSPRVKTPLLTPLT